MVVLAAVSVAAILFVANPDPAMARLDELVVQGAPYLAPPAVAALTPQRLYEVKPGDTLWDIARRNGISTEVLATANGLPDRDRVKAGQVLKLPASSTVHGVLPGETLSEIARLYRSQVSLIAARNGLSDLDHIVAGQQLYVPQSAAGLDQSLSSRGPVAFSLSWPLVGTLTSPFGMRDGATHEGIDIAAEEGDPVRAAASGRVVFAGPRGTYGLAVIVDHGGGVRTLYAHCSKLLVSEDVSIDRDTVIALAGSTGHSTGPHLHLEVLKDGVPLDPLPCLERGSYYG